MIFNKFCIIIMIIFYFYTAMNIFPILQKFKLSEAELHIVNHFSLFKHVPQIDFYYKMFEKLLSDIEKNFKPHVSYSLIKPSAIDLYSYEFWLSKTALLSITKQKDPDEWNWYVSFCDGYHNCYLFTTGIYSQRYGNYGWNEKENFHEMSKDDKKKCRQAFGKLFSVYKTIKNNYEEYVELLNAKLVSYKKREGIIPRKTYIELNRKLPEDHQDTVCAWLDDAGNADMIQKCLKYLKTPIKHIKEVTTRQFFEACKAYYQANPDWFNADELLKQHPKASARDWYRRFADGRDDGLTNVNQNSHSDYLEWTAERGKFCFNGHHPWEIERGMSVTLDAHLYIKKEIGKGYCFILSFHPFRVPQLVKGFVRMRELGIPVEINNYENLGKLLKCKDYIGIVEEHGDIIHKGGNRGNVFDYKHLPMRNSICFIKKITWKLIKHNLKR